MEEERRLFYVAMTRAKTRLHAYAVRRGTIKGGSIAVLCGSIWGGMEIAGNEIHNENRKSYK